MSHGERVRWRVMPAGGSVRLEVQLVGEVLTRNVHVTLSLDGADQLAHDLDACRALVAGQGSEGGAADLRPRSGSDLDARN